MSVFVDTISTSLYIAWGFELLTSLPLHALAVCVPGVHTHSAKEHKI